MHPPARRCDGRGASPVMIGREDELRQLVRLATTPGCEVALLAGEPGIGKTRLVQELLVTLPPQTKALVGQAEPGSLGRPFELLLSAIDRQRAAQAGAAAGRSSAGGRSRAAAGEPAGRPEPDDLAALTDQSLTQVERIRIALQVLQRFTADATVIVFEDLHWADPESIALFERLADFEGDRLLLGTYRPGEVIQRTPLADMLDRIDRRHVVYQIRLERFTQAQTSAFLAAVTGTPPPYRAAVSLHNRTGGDPFFLEELVRASNDLQALCDQPLPWSLAEALRRQVEHLDPDLQRLVDAASVLGYRVPFDLLAAVTGRPEHDLIWALRELVKQRVLVETANDEFSFRHELVREAVGERLLGRERRRLHEAAHTALLAAGGADMGLVAYHARGAGRYEQMLAAARQGAQECLANGSAYPALRLAEMGLDEAPDDPQLLGLAARAAWLAALYDDAEAYGKRWQSLAATPADRVAALCLRMDAAYGDRQTERMSRLHGELVAALTDLTPGVEQARAMSVLARSARVRDLDDEALLWVDRAVALAEQIAQTAEEGQPAKEAAAVRLAALAERGALLASRAATVEQGRSLLAEVALEAEAAGAWVVAAHALHKMIHVPSSLCPQEVAELLERMRRDAERAGMERFAVCAYYQGQARLYLRKGYLAAAMDAVERGRACDLSYQRTSRPDDVNGAFVAGLALELGDLDRAEQVAGELAASPGYELDLCGLRFHIACRRHDTDSARRLVAEVIAAAQAAGGGDGEFLHDLVSAAIEAPLPAGEVTKLIEGLDGPAVAAGYRRLVAAQYAEMVGELGQALPSYRAAADAESLPPATRGSAHVGAARVLIALHRDDEARVHAQRAAKLLAHWPGWRSAQLDAVQRRLGIAPATDSNRMVEATLTPREHEVARLIAEGLTNSELARRLFISPRTAAVHVSNILRKLGLTSRAEVAAALGISPSP